MKLFGKVIGARVHFFRGVRLKSVVSSPQAPVTITVESPGKDVLCFGLEHLKATTYIDIANGQTQSDGTYLPNWLEALAKGAPNHGKTLILLEFPPIPPEILEMKAIEDTIAEQMDAILNHSLRRLRPLFVRGGVARESGWVLDGCDLRYRYELADQQLMKGDAGLRHSLHRDLSDELGDWEPPPPVVKAYYEYLTGLSDDQNAYDGFVGAVQSAAGGATARSRRGIFTQGAAYCRSIFAGIPEAVRRKLINFLAAKVPGTAQQTRIDNVQLYMDESVAKAVIQYGLGEQLMNLLLFGYILSPEADYTNVVIVAGDDHIKALRSFLEQLDCKPLIAGELWSGDAAKDAKLGVFTDLPHPIELK